MEQESQEFDRDKNRPDGLHPYCKTCRRQIARARRVARAVAEGKPEPTEHHARTVDDRQYSRERMQRWRAAHPDRVRETANGTRKRLREQIFDILGRQCVECSATEGLAIDHINEDGGEHRRRVNRNDVAIARDVLAALRTGSHDYQALCRSCNTKKHYRLRRAKA